MKALRVVDWNKKFENNRTRELKYMEWVPVPNNHDGDGYTEILDHPDGMAHYGAWCLILQVASRCDKTAEGCGGRGTLLRDNGKPHDSHSLARRTRGCQRTFEEAIPRLISANWLEVINVESEAVIENPAPSCGNPAPSCDLVTTERNGTEVHIKRRLHGIPASIDEVVAFGRTINPQVPADVCRKFFSHYEGQARSNPNGDIFWVTSGGAVVTNWKAKLPSFSSPGSAPATAPQSRPKSDPNI